MRYTEPEINTLWRDYRRYPSGVKRFPGAMDAVDGRFCLQPAYDLDEWL
jgi:hypothetical protein